MAYRVSGKKELPWVSFEFHVVGRREAQVSIVNRIRKKEFVEVTLEVGMSEGRSA